MSIRPNSLRFLASAIVLVPLAVEAQLYSCVQPNGSTIVRSQPCDTTRERERAVYSGPQREARPQAPVQQPSTPAPSTPQAQTEKPKPAAVAAQSNTTGRCLDLAAFVAAYSEQRSRGITLDATRAAIDADARYFPVEKGLLKEVAAVVHGAASTPEFEARLGGHACKR